MSKTDNIEKWEIPDWHPDFGDPKKEIELLQETCIVILESGYDYTFELDCFEEGYISVDVLKNNSLFFDMQVVDSNENRIGVFFKNGDEHYITKPSEIIQFIK